MTYTRRKPVPESRGGGLSLDGSWNEYGSATTPLNEFVRQVQSDRRTSGITPREVASRILTTFLQAFPCRELWAGLETWDAAPARTSAESMIVYALRKKNGEPCSHLDVVDTPFGSVQYLACCMDTADRINRLCSENGLDHAYDPMRLEMHLLHGKLIQNHLVDPEEILRLVSSQLEELVG